MKTKASQGIGDLARYMALKSVSKFRLGAVLVKKGRVVSTGYNHMQKSHPLMQKYAGKLNFTLGLHAEVHTCIGVSAGDLHMADMWVCRVHRSGALAMALPCRVCQRFLTDVGIRRVYFTNTLGKVECLSL